MNRSFSSWIKWSWVTTGTRRAGSRAVLFIALGVPGTAFAAQSENWLKVVAPQFTLYTPAKSAEALRTAGEFQQFIGALKEIVPVDTRMLPPLTIVMFSREKDFQPFRPRRPNGKPWNVAGFFSRQEAWAVFGLAGATMDEDVRHTVFHEGVHWFLSGSEFPNPPWVEEGLAEVFSTFKVEKNRRQWGQPITAHVLELRSVRPLPLERLLGVSRADSLFNETDRTGLFYAESWAFVHLLLFGEHNQERGLFNDYQRAYRSGVSPDDAFKSAFKKDYRGMDRELANYLSGGKYFVGSHPLSSMEGLLKAEPADDLERETALVRLALGSNQLEVAQRHLALARAAGPQAPVVSELTGYAAAMRGDEAAMLEAFAEAAHRGSTDYRVYFDPAQRRHQAVSGFGGGLQLSIVEARQIAAGYERTINLRPGFLPAYQGLGGIIELLGPENKEDRKFLEQGQSLYPRDGMVQLGLATSAHLAGNTAESRNWLTKVLSNADKHPAHVNDYARRLDEGWAFEESSNRIRALVEAQRYEEAVAETDVVLAKGVPQIARASMIANRANLLGALQMAKAQTAWNEQRWSDARKLLEAVAAIPAQIGAKYEARRRLEELDRRSLGRD